ncbi:extracellular solute-binding protein [Alkanindiges sp. WGS2144]|uniref:extracellular solute-binding protein n=1 Tax=Alkanindiges sp. WGS2144 TaxID=3366808 RepID=UPI003752803C
MHKPQLKQQGLSRWLLAAIASSMTSLAGAAPVTQNYIALHSAPLYQHAMAMPYANPKAPKGGMLSQTAVLATFDNFNTLNGKGTPAEGVGLIYDTLMSASLDEPGVRYPLLAERVTYDPDDPSYVIYHLNPKARFSDGTPVQASDVVFSFNTLLSKGSPGVKVYLAEVDKVEALNPLSVRFKFKSKDNAELPLIVGEVPIYSQKDWQGHDYERVSLRVPVGSGPYLMDGFVAGRSITYKRNPNYWAKDLPVNVGRYNFNQIRYLYYRNLDIAFEGFKAGQYFFHEENKARTWSIGYNFPAFRQKYVVKQAIPNQNPVNFQGFVFNTRRPMFADIRVRQALTYAYDYEWLNKALFYGHYDRIQSYFYNSELAATGTPSPEELKLLNPWLDKLNPLQRKGVLANWQYPKSDASGFNRDNLLKARQLLLQAGYRYHHGKLVDQHGKPFKFEILIRQDGLQRTILPFTRNLARLGIDATIRLVDAPQYMERQRSFDFDILTLATATTISPGNEQAQYWGSASADQPGNYNLAGIKNPAIDAMIDLIIRAPNREQLIIRTRAMDRLLRSGYYLIPTYSKTGYWVAYWDIYRYTARRPKYDLGVDYWWVDPAREQKVMQYLQRQQQ